MSGGLDVLAMKDDDVTKLLAAGSHLGDANVDLQMSNYVFKTKNDGKKCFSGKERSSQNHTVLHILLKGFVACEQLWGFNVFFQGVSRLSLVPRLITPAFMSLAVQKCVLPGCI